MSTTAQEVVDELRRRGYPARLIPYEPPHTLVPGVNLFIKGDDRYPAISAWEPLHDADEWLWGGNFEHAAPSDIGTAQLVDRLIATLDQEITP